MDYNITYREKNNSIQCIVSYKDKLGKWKQKSKQGFKTKREAKKGADKIVEHLKENYEAICNDSELSDITFKEFYKIYIEERKIYITYNTLRKYDFAYKKSLNFLDLKIKNITNNDIQCAVNSMTNKGMKISTIKSYLSSIHPIFEYAMKNYNLIYKNPCNNIILKKENVTEKKALTSSELDDLISKITNPKIKIISILAGKCGMRIGEIIGLTWDCVDFKNKTIKVEKQWKELEKNKHGFGSLKTLTSYRIIPFSDSTAKALIDFKNKKFIYSDGRLLDYKNSRSSSATLIRYFRSKNYNISIHELRHTYATLLIENGTDFKTAAKLLGHNVEMTLKIYSHVNDDMMKRATNIINNLF